MAGQKLPILQCVALAAVLGIAGVALVSLMGGEREVIEVETDEKGRVLTEEELAENDHELRVAAARNEHPGYGALMQAFSAAGPDFYGDGELEIDSTRKVFDAVMDEVEIMAAKPRRLRQKEWHEVYRAANDSFVALSMHLDGKDSEQAKELEEAHRRLVQGLANVRVRGKKFRAEL
jgi:hypothetical protein